MNGLGCMAGSVNRQQMLKDLKDWLSGDAKRGSLGGRRLRSLHNDEYASLPNFAFPSILVFWRSGAYKK